MEDIEILLNDFAFRCFRNTADREYIHARLAYRHRLAPQFLWSSLHCLEKYAKCILLINRIIGVDIKHEVTESINRIKKQGKIPINLSQQTIDFINRLESGARFRYLEISWAIERFDIILLDQAVWEIRRYCQILDHSIKIEGKTINLFNDKIKKIHVDIKEDNNNTEIFNGWLEKILAHKNHPAKSALTWKNLYFGTPRKNKIRLIGYSEGENSPYILILIL